MKKFGLLPRLVLAIILGIAIGSISPTWLIRVFLTFSNLFSEFLNFIIPFIILSFIATSIAELGKGAGKLLGVTVLLAYGSTVFAGLFAFSISSTILPALLQNSESMVLADHQSLDVRGFIPLQVDPVMGVMTALCTAFLLGLGMSRLKSDALKNVVNEFQNIIEGVIRFVIVPLLPIHIFGIFANMTYAGEIASIMSTFGVVFIMVILLQIVFLLIQFFIAGGVSGKNPVKLLKNMLPAYFTAIGTQSSAATIPVTLGQLKKAGVSNKIAEFVVPLGATVHLSGSTISIVSCSIAIAMMFGYDISLLTYFPFILMVGVYMIAAPGVPGGAIMATLGILESMLGFDPAMLSLMIAIHLAQDSFGTACNVTGDGAIGTIVDSIFNKNKKTV